MASSAADAEIRFDNASRTAQSDLAIPIGGVPRALREAAESTGLDPLPQLYNEALGYATEGHLRLARERLQMLLCMAPDDGEARLLLGKVYVAGQRWNDALAAIDEADNCGQPVPLDLRDTVERQVRALNSATEEHRAASSSREKGEIKSLRAEARRLRSENAQMTTTIYQLEKETRKWAWTTAGVATLSIVFILGSFLVGGSSEAAPTMTVETDEAIVAEEAIAAPTEAPVEEVLTAPVNDAGVAAVAAQALADSRALDGTQLEVVIDGGKAQLMGQVISAKQRRTAQNILSEVDGISEVSTDRVEILARTRGTVHTVGSGETLSHIAMKYYGSVALTRPIAKANPGSKTLHIGDQLKIPAVD